MSDIKIKILKKNQLTKKIVKEICLLKTQHWKNSVNSQINWFENNIKASDLHFNLIKNKTLIGYVLLRRRSFKFHNKKNKYYYFDTLIIDKKYRGKKLSFHLMNATKNKIIEMKSHSFLICRKEMIKFYKKFEWKLYKKDQFIIDDHKFDKKYGMFLNIERLEKLKSKIIYYINK